jgi:SpoVK/Ycf46/Vps4 family AAA+-type ATPase
MATSDQIKALIQSHLQADEDRFMAVAMQVAAHAARQGHGRVADEIRGLVDQAKKERRRSARPVPIATPRGELAALLSVAYPDTRLSDMVLTEEARARFDRILREQRGHQKLLAHGLQPRRKLLLVGPPGSGKTMTAAALAGELRLPLYTLLLHGLITKFMGETAAKLRMIFDALAEQRGVYLFDEFDAIGGERAMGNDVGEIRRVLNSFLQFLEQDASSSLIIAATNHPETLDRALFRRFDDVITYDVPPDDLARCVMQNKLAAFETGEVDWQAAADAARGLSYADVSRACESAAKEAILDDTLTITSAGLQAALAERRRGGVR